MLEEMILLYGQIRKTLMIHRYPEIGTPRQCELGRLSDCMERFSIADRQSRFAKIQDMKLETEKWSRSKEKGDVKAMRHSQWVSFPFHAAQ